MLSTFTDFIGIRFQPDGSARLTIESQHLTESGTIDPDLVVLMLKKVMVVTLHRVASGLVYTATANYNEADFINHFPGVGTELVVRATVEGLPGHPTSIMVEMSVAERDSPVAAGYWRITLDKTLAKALA